MKFNFLLAIVFLHSNCVFALEPSQELYENKYECEFEFELGKADLSEDEVKKCLNQIPKIDKLKYVQIIGSANLLGNFKYNKKLSDKRIKTVKKYINNYYSKEIPTKEISIGKNISLDKKAYIVIVTESTQKHKTKVITETIIIKELVPTPVVPEKRFFLNGRLGRDIYMRDQIRPYFAYGFITGILFQKLDHIKFELGLAGAQMANDAVLTISTLHLLGGVYFTSQEKQGVFIGLRPMAGIVANHSGQIDGDFGGEFRTGYENDDYIFGIGLGRTQYITRVGFEIGIKF